MRVIFLIDGFNLDHSITDAQKDSGLGSKWLNIHSLMYSYLEHLSKDAFVIVSGDTDLIPGVDVVRRQFPNNKVFVAFPYKRKNADILSRVDSSFKMKADTCSKHQFQDPFIIGKKKFIKPDKW